jgi:hypothetical protein
MARPSTSTTRNLSLTEELEKLEQSITLTLQGRLWSEYIAEINLTMPQKSTTISVGRIG